ncbi:DUF3617 domain-containing protein [Undibacterium sp. Ji22W]|uniref:DUF3617 domain-containing protein n=1 Tax=Undibacterium sp. Ji22W TaxID=3413038 RepID=UPI003BF219C6
MNMMKNLSFTGLTSSYYILAIMGLNAFSASTHAEEKMKPGLWEMTVKSDMLKSMQSIPPAQLEELKKRGIKMPDMQDGAIKQKVCITKEMSEQNGKAPLQNNPGGCKQKSNKRQGNTYIMEMACDNPNLKGTGTVKATYTEKSLESSFDFKGIANRRPSIQHVETTGKWISADCGDIKPIKAPSDAMSNASASASATPNTKK